MKRGISFILIFCYLLMTTGVVAISHYCMNSLASVSFFASANKKCDRCEMDKEKHGCCTDEETFVKDGSDQNKISVTAFELPSLEKLPVLTTAFLLTSLLNSNRRLQPISHPPPLPDKDIYLQNNVFRI